jgi:lipopolysaccharide export system protein LptA
MIKIMLLSLLLIFMAYLGNRWVNSHEVIPKPTKGVGLLEGVQVRVFGGKGEEWRVYGNRARLEDSKVFMEDILLQSGETTLTAKNGSVDRDTGEGYLEGNVVLQTKEGVFKTDRVELRLKEGLAYGEGKVVFEDGRNVVEGVGWQVEFKPMRVIIDQAKVKLQ